MLFSSMKSKPPLLIFSSLSVSLSSCNHPMANICLYQQANRVHCVMHFHWWGMHQCWMAQLIKQNTSSTSSSLANIFTVVRKKPPVWLCCSTEKYRVKAIVYCPVRTPWRWWCDVWWGQMLPIVRSSTESGYLQNLLIVPDRVSSLDIIHPFCEVIQIPLSHCECFVIM